jgi:hypothetical protein
MSIDIVAKTFNKKEIFSGNVEDEHIRKVAKEYGFDKPRGNGSPSREAQGIVPNWQTTLY